MTRSAAMPPYHRRPRYQQRRRRYLHQKVRCYHLSRNSMTPSHLCSWTPVYRELIAPVMSRSRLCPPSGPLMVSHLKSMNARSDHVYFTRPVLTCSAMLQMSPGHLYLPQHHFLLSFMTGVLQVSPGSLALCHPITSSQNLSLGSRQGPLSLSRHLRLLFSQC